MGLPRKDDPLCFRSTSSLGDGCTTFEPRHVGQIGAVEAYQIRNLHLWRRLQRFVQSIRDKPEHDISPESITPSLSEALILPKISMWTKLPMNDFCSNKSWQQKGTYFAAAWDHALVAGDPFLHTRSMPRLCHVLLLFLHCQDGKARHSQWHECWFCATEPYGGDL